MTVYANKLEVSCKAQANMVIAAFPDVCMTPPENPATPPGVPVPYPNFGFDSDTDKGTGTVKIGGKTVNQKNKSYFTKTTGDEAGCAAKKGVITSKNTGKAYSQAFSMNVKAEAENLTRFSDIQTNNHASTPANAPPFPKISSANFKDGKDPCVDDFKKVTDNCPAGKSLEDVCANAGLKKEWEGVEVDNTSKASDARLQMNTTSVEVKDGKGGKGVSNVNKMRMKHYACAQDDACLRARKCVLVSKKDADKGECCGMQTGHHLIPEFSFATGTHGDGDPLKGCKGYDPQEAPTICVEGCCHTKGSHGLMHGEYYIGFMSAADDGKGGKTHKPKKKLSIAGKTKKTGDSYNLTHAEARKIATESVAKVFPVSDCNPDCIEAQLKEYHSTTAGISDDTDMRCDAGPGRGLEDAKRRSGRIDQILQAARNIVEKTGTATKRRLSSATSSAAKRRK
ncbi:PAAR-like domain-containing protein [Roseivivax isoporae]|uniref:Tox-GHH2 domain-containing protein n=1 Tax=Roseivivax isoporae LMG 25204 TaxID=1449351 RepID=X7FDX3_9RHOB|nr:PAAR-like domain-containing protein [Roseivivax isoporae]ETX30244.1 hypothetical protein RISW2_15530 [Roseivivax isoporae LMG 25204]